MVDWTSLIGVFPGFKSDLERRRKSFGWVLAQVGDVLTTPVLETSVREHRAIAKAILERDPAGAAARMREHLERASALALAGQALGATEENRGFGHEN